MSDMTILAMYIRDLEDRISRLERQDKVTPGAGGGGVGFSDGEGDPSPVGSTSDGTSAYAARRDHVHSLIAADVLAKLTTVDGAGSLLDADKLDGQEGAYYLPSGSYTAADALSKIKTVDGSGSGLDADTVDGIHASELGPPDAASMLSSLTTVDGHGSWLDADLLDGSHATAFASSSHTHSDKLDASAYTAADVIAKTKTVDGTGSGLDADLLDGQHGAYFLPASSYTAADVLAKLLTVDGATSGLDADYLDGLSSIYFLPASYYTAADVFSKVTGLDGPGSGLNADFLDGKEATDFAQLGASASFSGTLLSIQAPSSKRGQIIALASDNGTGPGAYIVAQRNSNATTPAAGVFAMQTKGNTLYRMWTDNSGNLRIWAGDPISTADTSGTVVGTQTSSLDTKDVLDGVTSIDDVLAAVQRGAEAVRRFTYKSGAYNGEEFEGVVVDYAPRYGMDRDEEHPAGKSLNVIEVVGDLLRAVAWLVEREQARS